MDKEVHVKNQDIQVSRLVGLIKQSIKHEDTKNDEKCCRGKTSRQKETINNQVRRSAGARIGRHVQL